MRFPVSKLRELRIWELILFCEATVWLVLAHALIALVPYSRIHRQIKGGRSNERHAVMAKTRDGVDDYVNAILRGGRYLPLSTKCLCRALAGKWMLGIRGIRSDMVIGVKTNSFAAHAWLTCGGVVVIGGGRAMQEYTTLGGRP
ncbi:lasso peptide biosynthesis B2 protein [Pelagicoccus sp. SDUM812002]|uniref:lasso peptide biosynthesis B2 protein n=1 Tax=Pelagicoccus sp. SDUM812002 TaxID=3041266 RepID=UPI0034E2C8D8